jgi:hypothetical protein
MAAARVVLPTPPLLFTTAIVIMPARTFRGRSYAGLRRVYSGVKQTAVAILRVAPLYADRCYTDCRD